MKSYDSYPIALCIIASNPKNMVRKEESSVQKYLIICFFFIIETTTFPSYEAADNHRMCGGAFLPEVAAQMWRDPIWTSKYM